MFVVFRADNSASAPDFHYPTCDNACDNAWYAKQHRVAKTMQPARAFVVFRAVLKLMWKHHSLFRGLNSIWRRCVKSIVAI